MRIAVGILAILAVGLAFAIGPDTLRYIKMSRM
jgi:hypothetical protein